MDNNISFSKIVATPTLNSWSQAYNAGKLFAVLSLEKETESPEIESLNMLGKKLLEHLEQEFFAIEEKNLESIKKAISTVFENKTEGVVTSFSAGALINNILYIFCLGNARVFIKRDANFGVALDCENTSENNVVSSSGFLKEGDLVVLTTEAFSEVVNQDDLDSSLNGHLPEEIAESLAPKIHKAENGKISAIIIKYAKPQIEETIDEDLAVAQEIKQEEPGEQTSPLSKYLSLLKSKFKRPNLKIQPTKKLFLAATAAIVLVLILSVFWGIQAQNNAKAKALFAQIYPQASKKYDEGQGLADLNKSLSRDAFSSAQKILTDNKDKFPDKSKEAIQVQDLLSKIQEGLAQVSPVDKSGLDRSTLSVAVQNGSGADGAAGRAANILKNLGYDSPSTGNADNYNYEGVTIKVKQSQSGFANLLKKDLAKDYSITSATSDLPSDSSSDAVVIVGK